VSRFLGEGGVAWKMAFEAVDLTSVDGKLMQYVWPTSRHRSVRLWKTTAVSERIADANDLGGRSSLR
jgi:hypothetical protein